MDSGELSMKRYILETPDTVRHNIACSEELTHKMTELYLKRMYRSIWLVACGSSCNAALCARYLMQKLLGAPVRVVTPFTFNHYEHDITERDFVVCISQSGCSTNTIESLQVCRRMGIPAVGLTGNIHSDFEKEADQVISFGLGGEKLDFVTKGVVTLSTFLMLFALHTAVAWGAWMRPARRSKRRKCGWLWRIMNRSLQALTCSSSATGKICFRWRRHT